MTEEQYPPTSEIPDTVQASPRLPLLERYGISPILFAFLSLIFIFVLYEIGGGLVSFLIIGDIPTSENVGGFRIRH
ncbi:MAG: hypothetical protein HY277_04845 [Ignavibacteriales bacterium]|nr:hypothetical protein [Ignavibacteriales bacterium]